MRTQAIAPAYPPFSPLPCVNPGSVCGPSGFIPPSHPVRHVPGTLGVLPTLCVALRAYTLWCVYGARLSTSTTPARTFLTSPRSPLEATPPPVSLSIRLTHPAPSLGVPRPVCTPVVYVWLEPGAFWCHLVPLANFLRCLCETFLPSYPPTSLVPFLHPPGPCCPPSSGHTLPTFGHRAILWAIRCPPLTLVVILRATRCPPLRPSWSSFGPYAAHLSDPRGHPRANSCPSLAIVPSLRAFIRPPSATVPPSGPTAALLLDLRGHPPGPALPLAALGGIPSLPFPSPYGLPSDHLRTRWLCPP